MPRRSKKDKRLDLFAAMPPLEAKKVLFSLAMTEGVGYERGTESEGDRTCLGSE